MNQSIQDNIALPSLDKLNLEKTPFLNWAKIKAFAKAFAKEMSVKWLIQISSFQNYLAETSRK